ncbi:uncharacterized protein LOC117179924 [Belonocnema kinseyi]|uniref:uncharacterized protein LOC117179924 n=1 Tax=Belonocnema kinseyi TaxID=2817044 RepID=UPI00143D4811|nr:uncharacterized protein LOC117179924 [Belonocnema kinseyi]
MGLTKKILVSILLAQCFSTVIPAKLTQDYETLHQTYVAKTKAMMKSFLSTISAELKAALLKGASSSCSDNFVGSVKTVIDPRIEEMTKCYTSNTDTKVAENCYKTTLAAIKKGAHDLHTDVKSCIRLSCIAIGLKNC